MAVNLTLTGTVAGSNLGATATGTGDNVLATSPTLVTPLLGTVTSGVISACTSTSMVMVTPVLGVAGATSINFGQDALNYYDEGTFNPTLTCATPGDFAANYSQRSGRYTRVGNIVTLRIAITAAPTFTTASGAIRISSLPFAVGSTGDDEYSLTLNLLTGFTWPSGTSACGAMGGTATLATLRTIGSAVGGADLAITAITGGSGSTVVIYMNGSYHVG